MKLYDYYRSTASYRVRIVLWLKKIKFETIEVHLINNGGEQHASGYQKINPQELVPTLEVDGQTISQSLAIINYLNNKYPEPALYSKDLFENALIESLALSICCDIHPLNNLRVITQLKTQWNGNDEQIKSWYHLWLQKGFEAIEKRLQDTGSEGRFCVSNRVTLADVCLIPQVYNAHRFEFEMSKYPLIRSINEHCLTLDAFAKTSP